MDQLRWQNRGNGKSDVAYILTIRERNHSWAGRSPAASEHASREDAEAALRDYVRRNWDAEMGTERPSDSGKMVEEYFGEVLEAYEILESA
jgi:hypothetical protein